MHIAIVSAAVSNKSGSRAPVELAVHLAKLGNKVSFFAFNTPFEKEAEDYLKQHKVEVYILGSPSITGRWLSSLMLLKLLKRLNPNIISTHCTFPFSVAARLSGKPVVKTYYGLQFFSWNALSLKEKLISGLLDKIILWREKLVFILAHQHVAISQYLAREAKDLLNGTADYIYIGVNKNKPKDQRLEPGDKMRGKADGQRLRANSPQLSKLESLKENNTPLLLSVSRIVPYKGFDVLIRSLNKIQYPWHLVVVGSYGKEEYSNQIKALADNRVTFLRGISDEDLYNLYNLCDIYSLGGKIWEGFGMPFLEAGLHGKPSVAFDHTALPEVILHSKTGYLAENEEQFTKYLEELIVNKKLREQMGGEAKVLAGKFTWSRCAKEYERLFQKMLNNS